MNEAMGASTSGVSAGGVIMGGGQSIGHSGEVQNPEILNQVQDDMQNEIASPAGGIAMTEEIDADRVLAYATEHGIEEGFEWLAGGGGIDEQVSQVSKVSEVSKAEKEQIEEVGGVDEAEMVENGDPEEITLRQEVEELRVRLAELTESQEGIKKDLSEITTQLANTAEITKTTVLLLYELVKSLHEQEEDKRRKDSLWMLLVKLTGFLTTSLLVGQEEGEKVLKGEEIK